MEQVTALRILFVEDVPSDTELTTRALKKGGILFESIRVDTRPAYELALTSFHPDIIISDYSMPEFNGMTALTIALAFDPSIPFILLTGSINEETAVECMKAGATDYIIKKGIQRLPFSVVDAIEKKKALTARRNAEQRYETAHRELEEYFTNALDLFCIVDAHGTILRLNKAWEFLLGDTIDALKGTSFMHLIHPDDREETIQVFDRLLKGEKVTGFNNRYLSPNGTYRWIETNASSHKQLIYVASRDITDRKAAEDMLTENEQRFRSLISSIPEAMIISDESSCIIEWNSAAEKIFGYSTAEIIGKNIQMLMPERYRRKHVKGIQRLLEGGKAKLIGKTVELEGMKKNGSIFPMELSLTAWNSKQQMMFGAIIRDISERKSANDALMKSESALKHAQHLSSIGNWTIVLKDGTVEWSDEMYTIFNIERKAFLLSKESFISLVHPGDRQKMEQWFQEIIEGASPPAMDARYIRSDGSTLFIRNGGEVILEANGNPALIVGTTQDVTLSKEYELKIHKLNRGYRVLSNVNHSIVRAYDRDKLFKDVCSIVVNDGGFDYASIVLFRSGTSPVECVSSAVSSGKSERKEFFNCLSSDLALSMTHNAKKPFVANDISLDRSADPFLARAAESGTRSIALYPLIVFHKVYGAFIVESTEADFLDLDERSLLEELAMDLSFGVEVIQNDRDRKSTFDALQESQAIFEQFLRNSPVHIFFRDEQSRILQLSSNYEKILGRPLSDLIGKSIREFVPPDAAETVCSDDQWMLATGSSMEQQEEMNDRSYVTTKFPIKYKGKYRYISGFSLDVTERNKAVAAIKESERFARATVDALMLHIAILDERGAILMVNTAWDAFSLKNNGSPETCSAGVNYLEVCDRAQGENAEEARAIVDGIRSVMNKDLIDFSMVYPCHSVDEQRWFQIRVTRFSGDGPVRIVVAHENITIRKQMEMVLLQSEKQYRSMFEANPHPMWVYDPVTLKFLAVNDSAVAKYGYSRDEFLTMTIKDIRSKNEVRKLLKALPANQKANTHQELWKHRTKDGRIIFVEIDAHPLEFNGHPARIILANDITERKKAEETLLENEERFRNIVESVRQAYFEADGRSLFTYCNPGLLIIGGYTEKELIGTSSMRLVAEEHRDRVIAQYRQWTREKKKDTTTEFRVCKKNGEQFWVEQTTHFEYDQTGNLITATNFLRDIHEKKISEQQVTLLAHAIRSIGESISITDKNGIITFVNDAFCITYGYTPEEMIGLPITTIRSPRNNPALLAEIVEMTHKGGWSGEVVNVRKNGEEFIVELSTSVIRDAEGMVIDHIGVAKDITERKKMEAAIIENELRLKNIIENSTNVFYSHDSNHLLHFVSPQIEQLLGYKPEEALINWQDLTTDHPMNAYGFQSTLRAIETGIPQPPYELELMHKNGNKIYVEVREAPVLENGRTVSIVGSLNDITARKRTEEALRENEERLRLSLQAANQGLFDLNIQTGDTLVNAEYAGMLGYDPETFRETNDQFFARMHPDDEARVRTLYEHYIQGTISEYRVEFRQRTFSGEWKWILSTGKIIAWTEDGKPLRMLGTRTDIHHLKYAEEIQLLQSTALETTANGIVITDYDGRIVWANNAFTKITGYTLQEAIGAKPSLLKSGKQSREFYETMWNTIKSGSVWMGSIINRRKDGSLYDDEMTITPVRNKNHVVTHFVAVKQDVTERNLILQRIAEQAMLLDEAHDAIILRDLEFTIRFWNKGAERLFGWTSEEVIGHDIRSFVYWKHDMFTKELDQLMKDGVFSGEMVLRSKNDSKIIADVRLNLVKDADGNPKSILSITNDITEKKKVEEQFLRTQRMGSLGTLAGGIAHDLNNVMAPILLAVDLLKRTVNDENSIKILDSVESSTRRGSDIVKQILTFARGVETQKILIQPRHLIKEIVGIFKQTFPRSITISSDIPNTIWTILGDPTHFHQLIMNLGVNARDAMPEGGNLSITAENETIDEHYVRMNIDAKVGRFVKFSITDTGIGMSAQVLDHIFEPFFTTKEIGKGTGLGLSTVYTIVKSHNGFLKVNSTPGKGTTFSVFLPASDAQNELTQRPVTEQDVAGNGELILVVDDEPSIRDVTKQVLETFAYSVITATDGAEGVARFAEKRDAIALVLTDMMMPVMDGNHLIKAVRKMNPNVIIIASSGLVDKLNNDITEQQNIDGFIQKPYSAEKLLNVVSSLIKKRNQSNVRS